MGYDARAVMLIGVWVDPEKLQSVLYTRVTVSVYCCTREPSNTKFCPECGKPTQRVKLVAIDGYNEDNRILCGYKLIGSAANGTPEFIAYRYTDAGPNKHAMWCVVDLEKTAQEMKDALKPLGLWSEDDFGIHVYLDESC